MNSVHHRTAGGPFARRSFSLLGSFSFLGLVSIAIISAATSYVLSNFLEEHLLRRDAVVMEEFVARIAQHHDPRGYFASSYSAAGEALNDFFEDISHMPDVARINAYSGNGTVVWSSDPTLLGKQFEDNEELEEAFGGELVYEKGTVELGDKLEHIPFKQKIDWFVENYIPVADADSGEVLGVVEIYRIPEALHESIESGRRLVWVSVVAGGMFLYLTLFWIVRRAHRLIQNQQKALLGQTRLATIGEMASSVAHSIRNPIASIRSSAELALDGSQDPDINDSLEDIIGEVDRFDGWIRELLTFASEPGDPRGRAHLEEVVDASIGGLAHRASRQSVEIATRFPDGLPAVRGEPRLLVQVVTSLISNALDAMPQGGSLVIDASRAGGRVRLTFADTGFGIPADKLEGLFDPLTTYKQGGLGIGLALARQIVNRYQGDITLRSDPGIGTTVVIELPVLGEAA